MDKEKISIAKCEATAAVSRWGSAQMKRLGYSAREWANLAGLSPTTITRGMASTSPNTTKIENLHILARAIGLPSVVDFIHGQADAATVDAQAFNSEGLARIVHSLVLAASGNDLPDSVASSFAVALKHALAILQASDATQASDETFEGAARAAVVRFREASQQ